MYRSEGWLRQKLEPLLAAGTRVEAALQWVRAAREQPPVLFVGAGFSLNSRAKLSAPGSKMMLWSELTQKLRDDLGEDADGGGDLWIAEKYRCLFGDHELHSRILEAVPDSRVEPGEAHRALQHISWHAILTLNWDTLIERALSDGATRTVVSVVDPEQAVRITGSTRLPVLHLHGHIEHPSSIVLSLEDFRKYPARSSVFLTIARQLLLQHPVMFLGFGANDPNFVEWSGWIRDTVGDHSPPWLRLEPDLGRAADRGMEAYWSPRLKTVRYRREAIPTILQLLGSAIRPLDASELLDHARDLVGGMGAASFKSVIVEVEKLLGERHPAPLTFSAGREQLGIVIEMLRSFLEKLGIGEAEIERYTGPSRDHHERWSRAGASFAPKAPISSFPTEDEQRAWVREKLASAFLPWLVTSARLVGRFVPVSSDSDTRFDSLDEYARLAAKEGTSKDDVAFRRELSLLTLPYELERLGNGASVANVLAWLRVSDLNELKEDASRVNAVIARHELEWGSELAGRDASQSPAKIEIVDAQTARILGQFAVLEGRVKDALEAYERAAQLSVAEMEPAPVQLITARSVVALTTPSGPALEDPRRDLARARVRTLEEQSRTLRIDTLAAEREHAQDQLKDARQDFDALRVSEPERNGFRGRSEPLEPLLEFFTAYAAAPVIYADIAEALGESRWFEGQLVSAAGLLARFGSDRLRSRVRVDVLAPRGEPIASDLIAELMRKGRWPHETRARIGALAELAPEVDVANRGELLIRAGDAYSELHDRRTMLGHGRRFPAAPAADLAVALARYTRWSEFKPIVERFRTLAARDLSQLSEANWFNVPLRWWVRSGALRGDALDEFFMFLVDVGDAWLHGSRRLEVFDALTSLASEYETELTKDARIVGLLRSWLDGDVHTQDDSEWVRTEAVFFIAKLEGRDLSEVRKERAAKLRGKIEEGLSAKEVWPNSFVLRAWVSAATPFAASDETLAHRLLKIAIPQEPGPDALGPLRAKRRELRAALAIASRVADKLAPGALKVLLETAASTDPMALREIVERPLNELPEDAREALDRIVTNLLNSTASHRERTTNDHHALLTIDRAIDQARSARDLPLAWLYGLMALTTATYPNVASYACSLLRDLVCRLADTFTAADLALLSAIRLSVLRATGDGRAYVVGAARRALEDMVGLANEHVRAAIVDHPETTARRAALEKDRRLAVVVAAEDWVRDWPAPVARQN